MRKCVAPSSLSLAFALAVAACGGPADPVGGVTATTEESTYAKGEVINLVVSNGSDELVRYEACPGRWDLKTAAGYTRYEEIVLCSSEITAIAAGESAQLTYSLPQGQPVGTYRIVLPVGVDREMGDTVRSAEFAVTE